MTTIKAKILSAFFSFVFLRFDINLAARSCSINANSSISLSSTGGRIKFTINICWINLGLNRSKQLSFFFLLRFYLLINERHRERGRDIGRERSRLHAGPPMWDLIPGFQDHALSLRQMLNHWATQASQISPSYKDTSTVGSGPAPKDLILA